MNRVKSLRKRMRLTQPEMAKELCVTTCTIARYESGKVELRGPVSKLVEIYEHKLEVDSSE